MYITTTHRAHTLHYYFYYGYLLGKCKRKLAVCLKLTESNDKQKATTVHLLTQTLTLSTPKTMASSSLYSVINGLLSMPCRQGQTNIIYFHHQSTFVNIVFNQGLERYSKLIKLDKSISTIFSDPLLEREDLSWIH